MKFQVPPDLLKNGLPQDALGLGLRFPHYQQALHDQPNVDFFELLTDNYLRAHPGYLDYLHDLRALYPLSLHGVGLSIGTPPDADYLARLKHLAAHVNPFAISDHLCFTGGHGRQSHDLLPVIYDDAALTRIAEHVDTVQQALGTRLLLENPSTYLEYAASTMPETEFLNTLCAHSGCALLLDINNVYVTCFNHGLDPRAYIDAIKPGHVAQYHLAGHTDKGTHKIDTHNAPVSADVLALYGYAKARLGTHPLVLERDEDIPPLQELVDEVHRCRSA